MIASKEYPPFAVDIEGNVCNITTGNSCKPQLTPDGYLRVTTKYKGKSRNAVVHRLLAIAFIPNPNQLPQVNHIDGIKTNNSIDNLEWCTNQDNSDHANSSGLRDSMLGEGSHFNVHSEDIIKTVCEMLQEGCRNIDICRTLDLPKTLVSDVRNKRSWTQLSDNYHISRNKRVSYSEDKIRFICNKLKSKVPYKDIALQTGVPLHTIRDIRHGKSFKHITSSYF